MEAELWGLFFGLQLVVSTIISNILIELDSALVVNFIKNPETAGAHPHVGLFYGYWDLMKKISTSVIHHVYR